MVTPVRFAVILGFAVACNNSPPEPSPSNRPKGVPTDSASASEPSSKLVSPKDAYRTAPSTLRPTGEPAESASASEASPKPPSPKDANETAPSAVRPTGEPAESASASEPNPKLLSPTDANETAPKTFKVRFSTTKGDFVVEAHRDWSPNGADRFYNLVKIGFFSDVAFFRAVEGFMVQFGIHGTPEVAKAWQNANIQDEPVKEGNKRARITFAKTGLPNTRSTQMFINYGDNSQLDAMGFSAFGEVVEGMDVVDSLNKEYGERPSKGQGEITRQGNAWLRERYPNLDYIKSASLVK